MFRDKALGCVGLIQLHCDFCHSELYLMSVTANGFRFAELSLLFMAAKSRVCDCFVLNTKYKLITCPHFSRSHKPQVTYTRQSTKKISCFFRYLLLLCMFLSEKKIASNFLADWITVASVIFHDNTS